MRTWITDANGNGCSIEYWGSEEKAREALATLKDCSGCSDCSDCSGCSGCYGCSGCFGCSDCSGCFGCSDCSGCSGCYGCSDCSGCFGCSSCSDFSNCSGCSGVKDDTGSLASIEVPKVPEIHKAVYEAASHPQALEMDTWHTCETTHCRAGWVVTLAGEKGKELEERFGTLLAAMKIYDASDSNYKINPCRFFDSNEDALEDMRKLAEGR